MEKQNKTQSTTAVPSIPNRESKSFPNQDSYNSSKDYIKDPFKWTLEKNQINKEQPVESETHFFKECARNGTFEDYSKRYPNGRYSEKDFNLVKSHYEELKAEETFGYIFGIIGLPFFIVVLIVNNIWHPINECFKYCDRKCVAMARSMDKYFDFQN